MKDYEYDAVTIETAELMASILLEDVSRVGNKGVSERGEYHYSQVSLARLVSLAMAVRGIS